MPSTRLSSHLTHQGCVNGRLTTKKIKRGAHTNVPNLERDIRGWIATWNENPRPYVWLKTADQILDSLARYCERISNSAH